MYGRNAAVRHPGCLQGGLLAGGQCGLVEILDRSIQIAFGMPREAPIIEGVGVFRFQPDGLVEILDRLI